MIDGILRDGLWDPYKDFHMGNAAEICATEYKISREDQDAYAKQSYQRAAEAWEKGYFNGEIVPVTTGGKSPVTVNEDEEFRKVNFDKMTTLKPAFQKDGTITAANASKINDGAAAVVLVSGEKVKELGLKPLARIVSFADASQAPEWFTTTPVKAVNNALAKAKMDIGQMDAVEINEAFSCVALANEKTWHSQREAQRLGRRRGPGAPHRLLRRPYRGNAHLHPAAAKRPFRRCRDLQRGRWRQRDHYRENLIPLLFGKQTINLPCLFKRNIIKHIVKNQMRQIAFRQALREAMQEEMRRDERVFLMGEEVAEYNGAYKVSQGMLDEFGARRVIDTPIAELGFTAIGVGAAQNGLRPVVEFMTWNFAVLAMDQILNTASKMLAMSGGQVGCPIVFRGANGSAGQLGAQHSTAFESYYANIPGLKVISVSNPYDAKGLLKAAIRDEDPVVFMESEQMYGDMGEVPEEEYIIPIGKADIKRAGKDVTIVSFNKMMKVALGAAEELAKEGIEAEVIDLRTIRPLDWFTILESVKRPTAW